VEGTREGDAVRALLAQKVPALLSDASSGVVDAAVGLVANFNLNENADRLKELFADASRNGATRAEVLNTLAKFKVPGFPEILQTALKDKNKDLSGAAAKLVGKLPADQALEVSVRLFEGGSLANAQNAVQTVQQLKNAKADEVLEQWMDRLLEGKVAAGLHLDLLEAATKRATPRLKEKLSAVEAARSAADPLAPWRECLEGGDAKNGLVVFREKDEVGCYRCHKAAGNGGEVGPAMDKIASKHDREYLLRSIVFPNADYAPGYETLLLKLADGGMAAGMVVKEDAKEIELLQPGTNQKQSVPKEKITGRDRLPSPMPEGLAQLLTKRELRDIVAFLASQR
jgi:quinoprotein glucose dehydrogenase